MRISRDRLQLFLSLLFNGISKLPAILMVTSILPLIKNSLGLVGYNSFLAALAFGGFFTLAFGGVNTVARRLVGARFAQGDETGQADAFLSAAAVMGGVALIAALLIVVLSLTVFSRTMLPSATVCSLLLIIGSGLNYFDNVRAAFNEHYVTAGLLFTFQLVIYVFVIVVHPGIGGMIMAGLIIYLPNMLTSAVQVSLLLVRRSYLLSGSLKIVPDVLRGSLVFSVGEGALSGAISLSVFYLSSYGSPSEGAWYGTLVRLFQSVSTPLMLVMFPISAFVATKWSKLSAHRRDRLITLSLASGFLYGGIVAFGIAIGSKAFLQKLYHIAPMGSSLEVAAISLFFMGIMAQKAYGIIIYAIDTGRFLSSATLVAVLVAAIVAAVAALWSTPLQALSTFTSICGLALLAVISIEALGRRARGQTAAAHPRGLPR
jgi:hypothetical protein